MGGECSICGREEKWRYSFPQKTEFRFKWNSNIKDGFKELTCEDVGLILLDQGILRIW